jgi:hypothetical protein
MWREIKILNTIVADKIQQQNYIPWGWWCGSSGTSKHNAVSSAPAPPKKKKKVKELYNITKWDLSYESRLVCHLKISLT